MSDSSLFEFSDDDEAFIQAVATHSAPVAGSPALLSALSGPRPRENAPKPTQSTPITTQATPNTTLASAIAVTPEEKRRLFAAEGEVLILRAQLAQLEQQWGAELARLHRELLEALEALSRQVSALKHAVGSLEDEKKILTSELRQAAGRGPLPQAKKRRLTLQRAPSEPPVSQAPARAASPAVAVATAPQTVQSWSHPLQFALKQSNEGLVLMDYVWQCRIQGQRRCLAALSHVGVDFHFQSHKLEISPQQLVGALLTDWLVSHRHLRLDTLLLSFLGLLVDLVSELIGHNRYLAIPFLLVLFQRSVGFRPAALTAPVTLKLAHSLAELVVLQLPRLDITSNPDDVVNYVDRPAHAVILEKTVVLALVDCLEAVVVLAAQLGPDFQRRLWSPLGLGIALFKRCLPAHDERLQKTHMAVLQAHVNMVHLSITALTFAFNDESSADIVCALFRALVVDVALRDVSTSICSPEQPTGWAGSDLEHARFIDRLVPVDKDALGNSVVVYAQPPPTPPVPPTTPETTASDDIRQISLRLSVLKVLDTLAAEHELAEWMLSTSKFSVRENFQAVVRLLEFEQMGVAKLPRSPYVHLRLELIGRAVAVIHALMTHIPVPAELMFNETLAELTVALARIAFAHDALAQKAAPLVKALRELGYTGPIFNPSVESQAREAGHVDWGDSRVADLEIAAANGLEFAYDSDTVDLAREILEQVVTTDEIDNLFYCMHLESIEDE